MSSFHTTFSFTTTAGKGHLGIRERHHNLAFAVEMEDQAAEILFVQVADNWKVGSGSVLLLIATPFDKVQKIIRLWRSQRKAHSLWRETLSYASVFLRRTQKCVFMK